MNNPETDAIWGSRPMVINPILGKVLKELLKNKIYYFMSQNGLLQTHESGFKRLTSTANEVREITRRVE